MKSKWHRAANVLFPRDKKSALTVEFGVCRGKRTYKETR